MKIKIKATRERAACVSALKPPRWKALYAIARNHLSRDPAISDGEWVARIKDTLAAQRYAYPHADRITAAVRAVEHQHPRPVVRPEVP